MLLDIRYQIHLLIFYKNMKANLELWLIKMKMLMIWQLVCVIYNFFRYEIQFSILTNMLSKTWNNGWLKIKKFLIFRYEMHYLFYANIWITTWNYGWFKIWMFLIWQLVCIICWDFRYALHFKLFDKNLKYSMNVWLIRNV